MTIFHRPALTALLLAGFTLTACESANMSTMTAAPQEPTFVMMAPTAPPLQQYEPKPWPPTDPWLVAWRPGFWDWNGKDFSWVPGQYIPKPSASAVWRPDVWEKKKYGWVFVPGYWQ
jgi:hypothetical protein